jgi:hypothetical protein
MHGKRLYSAVLTGAFIFAVLAAPQPAGASEIDRLLDLLVKKNLVTQEEATALREQAAMEAAAEKTATAAAVPASEPAKHPVAELSHSAVGKQSSTAERKEFPVTGASRIKLSGWGQARWTNGASGPTEVSRERAGVEFAYTRELYSLRGEYIWGHDGPVRKYGWHSQFAYKFRPKWEALARFDTFDPRRHAGNDVTNTYLVGINWYLNSHVKLQANYGVSDEETRTDLTNLFLSQLQFQF